MLVVSAAAAITEFGDFRREREAPKRAVEGGE
jgi:hypothetical protein